MSKILKPTKSVEKGLEEFGKEKCLEALRLHEECGYGANTVALELTSPHIARYKSDRQLTIMGDRMINTGRYLKYSFSQNTK